MNEICGYSKDAINSKFKHPYIGIKIDRTTEDVAAPVPPTITKNYLDVHLDIDKMFVNNLTFLIKKSRDIKIFHFKVILIKSNKQVVNELISIVLDYEAKRFKVTITFADNGFKSITKWLR